MSRPVADDSMNGQKSGIPLKKLALFMLFSIVVMYAWSWYQNKDKQRPLTADERREVLDATSQVGTLAPIGNGLGDFFGFVGHELHRQIPPEDRAKVLAEALESKRKEEIAKP